MRLAALPLSEGRTNVPMATRGALPELKAFAEAYNRGLRRIEALTGELQQANETLAHELRTPLARIRGNLESYFDLTDHPEARDAAARGLEEIDRATRLVHSILTIRAGDHGALILHREPTDLSRLLTQMRDLYLPAASQLGLALDLQVPASLTLPVDAQQLSQAVANLLDNALAYTPSGGSVRIHLHANGSFARISVIDSGRGLTSEELETVWQRHARGSAAGKHQAGLGLGLSIVRAIANAHDGAAGCANGANHGAIFWIDLPLPGK